ncbi:hypothetical protein HKX48_006230 [Thoreauomyces humboldtii]|nr:hypothetical protein HKX48_006230 [Thoreauomyces humboldtii]
MVTPPNTTLGENLVFQSSVLNASNASNISKVSQASSANLEVPKKSRTRRPHRKERRESTRKTAVMLKKPPTVGSLIKRFFLMLVVDVILPVVVFFVLKMFISDVWALLIGCVPALLSVIVKLIWYRSVDVIGLLVAVAFAISAVVAAVTSNARLLVFEKSVVTVILGFVFLFTLLPIRGHYKGRLRIMHPMVFTIVSQIVPLGDVEILEETASMGSLSDYTASDTSSIRTSDTANAVPPRDVRGQVHPESSRGDVQPDNSAEELMETNDTSVEKPYEDTPLRCSKWIFLFATSKRMRFDMRLLTAFWGCALIVEFLGRLIMVLSPLSISNVVLFSNVYFAVVLILGCIITIAYAARMRRRVRKEIAQREEKGEIRQVEFQPEDVEMGHPQAQPTEQPMSMENRGPSYDREAIRITEAPPITIRES